MRKSDEKLFENLSKKFDELFGKEDSSIDGDDFRGFT